MQWFQHLFGFRNGDGNSPEYLFWSGIGSDLAYLTFLAGAVGLYRKHVCQMRWCPRLGRHQYTDPHGVTRPLCWRHHPDVTHKNLTRERLHLYVGSRPGRG